MSGGTTRILSGTTPPTPPAGYVTLWVDTADDHLKQIDSSGTVIDLTDAGVATVSDTADIDLTLAVGDLSAVLTTTGVTPDSYTSANITVDDKGRITAASNGQPPGQVIYKDGTFDTEAEILAIDPSLNLGKTLWARDTNAEYLAETSTVSGSPVARWQKIRLDHDPDSDSWSLPTGDSGITLNLGEEIITNCYNDDITPATALNPKVFKSVGAKVGDEKFLSTIKIAAADIVDGEIFGINTNDANVAGKYKLLRSGLANEVNTSAWSLNAVLFIDPTTPGDLTDVRPTVNARVVAVVLKVGATDGILLVETIGSNRLDSDFTPVGFDRIWFTGDTIVLSATFYEALRSDQGTVAEATETAVVPDNSTVALGQDHVSIAQTVNSEISAGEFRGQVEFEVNSAGAQERITFEIYDSDGTGVPIDSGIPSEPVGDLGVKPIFTMQTALLDVDANDIFFVELVGAVAQDYNVVAGNRLRFHILCEKVGAAGGDKTFTIYFGSDHRTFIDAPQRITTDEVFNVSDVPGATQTQVNDNLINNGVPLTHADPAVTGVLTFTGLVQNGTTQVDVGAGTGEIVNFYDNYSIPTRTSVSWGAQTIVIPNLGVDDSTYIYVDNTGTIQTQSLPPSRQQDRDNIFLGLTLNDTSISQIFDVIDAPVPIGTTAQSFIDQYDFSGVQSRGGTVEKTADPGTNGDLSIAVSAHELFFPGINWVISKSNPNINTLPAVDPMICAYILQTGDISSTGETKIDPTIYDNGGTLDLVPTTGGGRRSTIQYIYQLVNGTYAVLLGQTVYDDLTTAKAFLDDDVSSLIIPEYLQNYAIPLAAVLVSQNAIDLDDPITSDIVQFESSGGAGGGSGGATTFDGLTDTPVNKIANSLVATDSTPTNLEYINTLAELNSKISDATLDSSVDGRPPIGSAGGDLAGMYPNPTVNDGADSTAIHDNIAGEINAITNKATPVGADKLLIEDSADSFNKKEINISDLPAAGEANTSSNVGTGDGLALPKIGVDLPFKSLVAGTNITLTPTPTHITIDAAGGGGSPEPVSFADIIGYRYEDVSSSAFLLGKVGVTSHVRDSTDAYTMSHTGLINVNIVTTQGPGGRDIGSLSSPVWYAVYIIGDSNGVNPTSAIVSESITGPSFASAPGYDIYRLVNFFFRQSTGILAQEHRENGSVIEVEWQAINLEFLTAGNASTLTPVNVDFYCPPGTTTFLLGIGAKQGGTNATTGVQISPTNDYTQDQLPRLFRSGIATTLSMRTTGEIQLDANSASRQFYYNVLDFSVGNASFVARGWRFVLATDWDQI